MLSGAAAAFRRTLLSLLSAFLLASLSAWTWGQGPLHEDPVVAVAGRVRALLQRDLWREAMQEARALASEFPGQEGETVLGEALYRAGLLQEAGELLEPMGAREKAPARALLTLGLVRVAEGREEEAASLIERAYEADPRDRHVLFWAAGAAGTSARAVKLLQDYLTSSAGDDPDRIEAARGTLAFYRTLGERKVWIPVERPARLQAPLRPLGSVRAGLTGYVLEASLGQGRPVRLLLDTGSTGLFLADRIARRHHFAPLAQETTFGGGGDQRHRTWRGILPSFSIGELRFRDALATTTTAEIEPTGQYHGILGLQIFDGYRVTLDLERGRLVLEPAGEEALGTRYWTVSSQLLVEAEGSGTGQRGLFLLDTGATTSLVSTVFAASLPEGKLEGPAALRGYGGKVLGATTVRGVRLGFQGLQTPGDRLAAADLTLRSRLGGVEISGFLGLDLLQGVRIVIDTKSRGVMVQRGQTKGG